MKFTASADSIFDWSDYRRVKRRLILLLGGAILFGVLIAAVLPDFVGYAPSYLLAASYAVFTGFAWFEYRSYPCVNCERPYRGQQLHRRRCSRCGILINK